jgi:DNA-binding CsgD family transcriptional regulator
MSDTLTTVRARPCTPGAAAARRELLPETITALPTLVTGLTDGCVRHADEPAETFFRCSKDALIGRYLNDLLVCPGDDCTDPVLSILRSGVVDSVRAQRTFRLGDRDMQAVVFVRRAPTRTGPVALWTLLPAGWKHGYSDSSRAFWGGGPELASGCLETSSDFDSLLASIHPDDRSAVRISRAVAARGSRTALTSLTWCDAGRGWIHANCEMFATGVTAETRPVSYIVTATLPDRLAHDDVRPSDVRRVDLVGFNELSTREREVVERLLRGERVHGIAEAMFLSRSTVRTHLSHAFHHLGVGTQEQLVGLFLRGSPAGIALPSTARDGSRRHSALG